MPDADVFGVRHRRGFEQAERQLAEYFAGERTDFELETAVDGDEFQRRVWELIERIPYGQTDHLRGDRPGTRRRADPGAQGRRRGRPQPALGDRPCHRVVGKDGKLTGYAGGLERKRFLLELETPDGGARGARLF